MSEFPLPSDELAVAVRGLVESAVGREYGRPPGDEQDRVAWDVAAVAALYALPQLDVPGAGLVTRAVTARYWVRHLVREGLAARLCQCTYRGADTRHMHPRARCEYHFEADVEPLDGLLLCGWCHNAVRQDTQAG